MALDVKQVRYLERFFPGLIASVEGLGAGEFLSELPMPRSRPQGLAGIQLNLTYLLTDDHDIEIKLNLELRPGRPIYIIPPPSDPTPVDLNNWQRIYYRLHYGKRLGDCIFRFDLNAPSGHHVHIRPNPKLHIASKLVEPDVTDLDPRTFILMVAEYRNQGTYPVRKKPQ